MSNMSELDFTIQEFTRGDEKAAKRIEEDLCEYWNGCKEFHEMSPEAQYCLESYETGQIEDLHGSVQMLRDLNTSDDDQLTLQFNEEDNV